MKKVILKSILFFLFFFSCSKKEIIKLPVTSSSEQALEYYKKAMYSLEVGDDFEKRLFLDSALSLDSEFIMALELYDSPDPILTKKNQELAKKLSINGTEAERNILCIRESYRNGDMDNALKCATWLIKNHPLSYESYVWLGLVQSDRNELDSAIQTLKKATKLNPNSYGAFSLLMGHHIAAGNQVMLPENERDVELGMKYGDELIRIRSDHGLPYHLKANCYRQLGEFEKAKPLYEKSIEKRKGTSSEGNAYNVSAHNYMFSGDIETARKRYLKAIELSKNNPNTWFVLNYYLTVSYMFENDYLGAIDNISKIGEQLDVMGFDEASLLFRKGQINWQKMVCYAHNQMEEEAFSSLEKQIFYNKKRADLLRDENVYRNTKANEQNLKAWLNILFGKYEEAKKNLEKFKELQEQIKDPTAMYGYYGLLGMANLMEGNYEMAVSNFKKADNTNIYFNYFKGLALKASGNENEAMEMFKELASYNFSSWDIAIIRNLAKKQLQKV